MYICKTHITYRNHTQMHPAIVLLWSTTFI